MKKLFMLIVLLSTISVTLMSQTYTCSATYGSSDTYYLDRRLSEVRAKKASDPITAGLITRAGYAFNYDAFTYGASIYYQWSRLGGITAGFDGYYIPNKRIVRNSLNDTISSNMFSLPLWNIRAGFMLSKYFMFGGMLGKVNIKDETDLINLRRTDAWFIQEPGEDTGTFLYGGFVTFLLPISKHLGFNIDFAVTNKTGFNIGMGVNATIPIK